MLIFYIMIYTFLSILVAAVTYGDKYNIPPMVDVEDVSENENNRKFSNNIRPTTNFFANNCK